MTSGRFNELPDWPDVTETLEALLAAYRSGLCRNPRALDHVRPIMMRGNVRPSDGDILEFLAALTVTLPAVLAVYPEWRDQPTMRKALETISELRNAQDVPRGQGRAASQAGGNEAAKAGKESQ